VAASADGLCGTRLASQLKSRAAHRSYQAPSAGRGIGSVHVGSRLRPVVTTNLEPIFEQMRDPESVRMAAFTVEDPSDRNGFDAHMEMVITSPEITLRAVTSDDLLVGTIASFAFDGSTEVTYWIDRAYWGQGVASRALALFASTSGAPRLHGSGQAVGRPGSLELRAHHPLRGFLSD